MSIFIRTFACMKKNTLHTNLVTTIKALLHVVSLLSAPLLLTAAILMAACSSDDANDTPTPTNDNAEIAFTTATTTWHDATRATTYDGGTLTSGSFTAASYVAESTTAYFTPVTVNWETDKWVFSDGKHYWPAEGALDFFAYMPAAVPSYITNMSDVASLVTYAARNPQFKCKNLPMTYDASTSTAGQGSGLQEFVYALTTGRTKALDGADGVTLNFQHPFARIDMKLSDAQAKPVTINTITFKTLKNNGTYTHNGSPNKWALTGDATDFKVTLDQDYAVTGTEQTIGTSYLMIPQNWTGNIEVEATWVDWGVSLKHTLTKQIDAVTWAPGTSYTYTFTITETDLIVNTSKYTEQW
jgi:hypothetical protein